MPSVRVSWKHTSFFSRSNAVANCFVSSSHSSSGGDTLSKSCLRSREATWSCMSFHRSRAFEDRIFSVVEISFADLPSSHPNDQTSLFPRLFGQGALGNKFNSGAKHPQYHKASVLGMQITLVCPLRWEIAFDCFRDSTSVFFYCFSSDNVHRSTPISDFFSHFYSLQTELPIKCSISLVSLLARVSVLISLISFINLLPPLLPLLLSLSLSFNLSLVFLQFTTLYHTRPRARHTHAHSHPHATPTPGTAFFKTLIVLFFQTRKLLFATLTPPFPTQTPPYQR